MLTSAPDLQQLPAVVQARSDWQESSKGHNSPGGQQGIFQGGCGISILIGLPNSAGPSEQHDLPL